MSAWAVQDKTESWDAVCDRAWAGEPQFITRGPSQTVVVISLPVYHRRMGCPRAERRYSAHDLIGYGRKYGGLPRTSAEWLHEIREGDEA